jgi:putative hemolysin
MVDFTPGIIGLALVLFAGFFVAAEYAIVSSRITRLESNAKRGNPLDVIALKIAKDQAGSVAAIQVWITLLGIGIGALLEEWLTALLAPGLKALPEFAVSIISLIIISFPLVILGELVPKYVALQHPESALRFMAGFLRALILVIKPISWLLQKAGELVLKLLRIPTGEEGAAFSREELHFLIRSGESGTDLQKDHAKFVTKALRLDELDAEDAMLHRLDIKWLDAKLDRNQVVEQLIHIPYSRIPICNGDVDDIVGIAYLHDIVIHLDDPEFDLTKFARPAVYVPESLSLNRLVEIMRETKSQIVIVQDEYGGTQGLATLEDVIEEIFGDMEDRLESERPTIERTSTGRISLRSDVRYDELLEFLEAEPATDDPYTTESLAAIIVEHLDRNPKLGDTVDLPLGRLRVEQAARNRIVRIGFYPNAADQTSESVS